MSGELDGKVAIVTGSARNIGRAIALDLARAGAAVVVNAQKSADEAKATADAIAAEGGRAVVHLADVTQEKIFAGGIIPDADIPKLKEMGVAGIFTPGAPLASITDWLASSLDRIETGGA